VAPSAASAAPDSAADSAPADSAPADSIRRRLALTADDAELRAIGRLWIRHSIAEDRRDIDGLVATLTPDCAYEILGTDLRWLGHDGARAFYDELFAAFPDNRFDLTDIVVGAQGVFEAATLTATHLGRFAGLAATGRQVSLTIGIHFPWDRELRLFRGERILVDRGGLRGAAGAEPAR
jgi:predicted ester cyclase